MSRFLTGALSRIYEGRNYAAHAVQQNTLMVHQQEKADGITNLKECGCQKANSKPIEMAILSI